MNDSPAVVLYDAEGNPVEISQDGSVYRLAVDAHVSAGGSSGGRGSVSGSSMRYERLSQVDLNRSSGAFKDVYTIDEESVFYKVALIVDSDNIDMKIEIDGQDIFPSSGIKLEDLEDMELGGGGGGGGYYGGSSQVGTEIGLFQYSTNKWMWIPPDPLYVASSLKIQMRSSNNSPSRDLEDGLAIRRVL